MAFDEQGSQAVLLIMGDSGLGQGNHVVGNYPTCKRQLTVFEGFHNYFQNEAVYRGLNEDGSGGNQREPASLREYFCSDCCRWLQPHRGNSDPRAA